MSCGCRKGVFAPEKDTWSCKSSLEPANWDPYPELQNPKNCYGANTSAKVEGYDLDNCAQYQLTPAPIANNGSSHILQRAVITNARSVREAYGYPKPRQTYSSVAASWSPQTPYTL